MKILLTDFASSVLFFHDKIKGQPSKMGLTFSQLRAEGVLFSWLVSIYNHSVFTELRSSEYKVM